MYLYALVAINGIVFPREIDDGFPLEARRRTPRLWPFFQNLFYYFILIGKIFLDNVDPTY